MKNKKPILLIMAGGKSSRFGGSPKILETFNYNKDLFKKYFNVFIVTSNQIFNEISHLDCNFIIQQDMGKGSGFDVYNIVNKLNVPLFIAWSDVFFNEKSIIDILNLYKLDNTNNIISTTYHKNPYVSLIKNNNNIIIDWKYNEKDGYQDNSIFFINKLINPSKEFMEMAIKNNFKLYKTKNSVQYFNTKEELKIIKENI